MKLIFTGVGGAFADLKTGQSNAILQLPNKKNMLIDCGTDIRHSLVELWPDFGNHNISEYIEYVFLTHLHADHCGGLEWLGFCTFFSKSGKKPKLLTPKSILIDLWEKHLSGGMGICPDLNDMQLDDFFEIFNVHESIFFRAAGVQMWPIKSTHVIGKENIKNSYGLFIDGEKKKVYYSSDVCSKNWEENKKYYYDADIIFHECETTPYKSGVHFHYEDLKMLPEEIKSKMLLYHYSDDAHEKYNPEDDGFIGFAQKHKEYEI